MRRATRKRAEYSVFSATQFLNNVCIKRAVCWALVAVQIFITERILFFSFNLWFFVCYKNKSNSHSNVIFAERGWHKKADIKSICWHIPEKSHIPAKFATGNFATQAICSCTNEAMLDKRTLNVRYDWFWFHLHCKIRENLVLFWTFTLFCVIFCSLDVIRGSLLLLSLITRLFAFTWHYILTFFFFKKFCCVYLPKKYTCILDLGALFLCNLCLQIKWKMCHRQLSIWSFSIMIVVFHIFFPCRFAKRSLLAKNS